MTPALILSLAIFARAVPAQQAPGNSQRIVATAANPLAELKDEVKRALTDAQLPFTEEQERGIVIMMEDRRAASEDLFGNLMDFQAGPTRGEDADRLRSAIEWMRQEFLTKLQDYLTPEQLKAWTTYRDQSAAHEAPPELAPAAGRQNREAQTQYVRINNNSFTAEDGPYRFGQNGNGQVAPQVVARGGSGAFHGDSQLLFKDSALNARNAFAGNKPPYEERQVNVDISGPIIPRKLSTSFAFSRNEAQNVDTIHATMPDGLFALGITRPTVKLAFTSRNTYQPTEAHALSFNVGYGSTTSKNQGIGEFVLTERAYATDSANWNVEFVEFSNFSARTILESHFKVTSTHDETKPATDGVRINVLDAFSSGGAQNRTRNTRLDYEYNTLYSRLGEKLTTRTGAEGRYRTNQLFSQDNFGGTFIFSNLQSYVAGKPLNYRVTLGNPLLETNQLEVSFFHQNDWKISPELTLMFGARYDVQTNMQDHNNIAPRLAFAYSPSRATVIRGGGGVFFLGMDMTIFEGQRRLDGRQYELVIDNPSYPDPFNGGTIRNAPPSLRVFDPRLVSPYVNVGMISVERTFFTNLLMSAAYDYQREYHRMRERNLNAPYDSTVPFDGGAIPHACTLSTPSAFCVRPDPARGDIGNLEASSNSLRHTLRLNFRQRFSIFNVTASYLVQRVFPETNPGNNTSNTNGPAFPTDNWNLRADYHRSHGTGYPTHNVNTSVNARLPFGLFLTNTMSLTGPKWYNITTGKDDNRDGVVNDRPPGVPRNSAKGPAQLIFNFNISKAFFFGTAPNTNGRTSNVRTNLNVFANMTNAFNRTNVASSSGVITSPNFGKATGALDPRQFEVGTRFQF